MEEIKIKSLFSLFDFVKAGMINSDKTWSNLDKLTKKYDKIKNQSVKFSNNRIIFDDGIEIELRQNLPKDNSGQSSLEIILIAAITKENGIGFDNSIPWHLPNDFKRFRELTSGHPILMGRKTFESLPGILPNRPHIIITRNKNYRVSADLINQSKTKNSPLLNFFNIDKAIEYLKTYRDLYGDKLFVIGGAEIYKQTIDMADRIEITRIIHKEMILCDTFFPTININKFLLTENIMCEKDERHRHDYHFKTYKRNLNYHEESLRLSKSLVKQIAIKNYLVSSQLDGFLRISRKS